MDMRQQVMDIHMKTTLVVHDDIMRRIKQDAARRGRTISEVVESALLQYLGRVEAPRQPLQSLPSFSGGRLLVDVSDREGLDRVFDEE